MSNPGLSYRPPRRLSDVPELLRLSLKLTISPVRGLGLHTGERNNLKNNAKGGSLSSPEALREAVQNHVPVA